MFALFSTQVVPGPQSGPVADLEPVSLVLTDKNRLSVTESGSRESGAGIEEQTAFTGAYGSKM